MIAKMNFFKFFSNSLQINMLGRVSIVTQGIGYRIEALRPAGPFEPL